MPVDMQIQYKKNHIACIYERERCHISSRDRMIFYRDGAIKFESYCYGEAATLIFECFSAAPLSPDGTLNWPADIRPPREVTPPAVIRDLTYDSLYVEDKPFIWNRIEDLKSDPANGYNMLKSMMIKNR